MADGFNLILQDYCSYCGEFKADVNKTEITSLGDKVERYTIDIRCENEYRCAHLSERLNK